MDISYSSAVNVKVCESEARERAEAAEKLLKNAYINQAATSRH